MDWVATAHRSTRCHEDREQRQSMRPAAPRGPQSSGRCRFGLLTPFSALLLYSWPRCGRKSGRQDGYRIFCGRHLGLGSRIAALCVMERLAIIDIASWRCDFAVVDTPGSAGRRTQACTRFPQSRRRPSLMSQSPSNEGCRLTVRPAGAPRQTTATCRCHARFP